METTNNKQQNDILTVQTKALTMILRIVVFGTTVFVLNGAYVYWLQGRKATLVATSLSFLLWLASLLSLYLVKKGHYFSARRVILTAVFLRVIHWLLIIPDSLFPIAITYMTLFIIIGIFLSTPREGFSWLGLGFLISISAILIRNINHTALTIQLDPHIYFYAIYFFPLICMTIITTICLYVVRQFQNALVESAAARKSLEQTNKTLESFAYIASHDLQEPLRTMTSFAQLLERDNQENFDQDSKTNIQFIVDGAKRMRQLINDLLQYSRLKTQAVAFQPVSLNEITAQVLKNLKASLEENGAQIVISDLPTIDAHSSQMIQLFQNLIGNALKFHSETPAKIEIAAVQRESSWLFSVKDNGIGLDPKNFEKIFEIFQRLNSQEKYPGTGMGLAICQEVVAIHGGKIWVESEPGIGSIFFFTLPNRQV